MHKAVLFKRPLLVEDRNVENMFYSLIHSVDNTNAFAGLVRGIYKQKTRPTLEF